MTLVTEKFAINKGLGWLQTGGDSGAMFATWLVCLKFPQWKYRFKILYAKRRLLQVYFMLATARFARHVHLNATLPCSHDTRQKTFQTSILLNNVNSTVARSKITDVATMVMEECQKPSTGNPQIAVFASQKIYVSPVLNILERYGSMKNSGMQCWKYLTNPITHWSQKPCKMLRYSYRAFS